MEIAGHWAFSWAFPSPFSPSSSPSSVSSCGSSERERERERKDQALDKTTMRLYGCSNPIAIFYLMIFQLPIAIFPLNHPCIFQTQPFARHQIVFLENIHPLVH
ncbi:hypothetical protein CUMW_155240 [Citrus unshiu]|nr:hypothetical protein CUMW_155240 [Citrus unshiu]